MENKCELCGRENVLTFHHLIPVTLHKNKWFKKNYTREEMNTGVMELFVKTYKKLVKSMKIYKQK